MIGYKPWDVERLYDYDIDIASGIIEAYRENQRENLLVKAYYSFQMAMHIRSNKGFKFDDFLDLLGADYMEEIRKKDYQRSRAYIDELRANGEDY